jgi:hypothetical protein
MRGQTPVVLTSSSGASRNLRSSPYSRGWKLSTAGIRWEMQNIDAGTWSARSRAAAAVAGALFMLTLGALFGVWVGAGHPHNVLQGLTDPVKPAKAARLPAAGHSRGGTTVTMTEPGTTVTTDGPSRTVTETQPPSTVTETSTVTVTTSGTTATTASP